MKKHDLLRLLRQRVEEAGGQRAFARGCGLSQAFVSDVLSGKKEPADKLLAALGVRRVVTYEAGADNGLAIR